MVSLLCREALSSLALPIQLHDSRLTALPSTFGDLPFLISLDLYSISPPSISVLLSLMTSNTSYN